MPHDASGRTGSILLIKDFDTLFVNVAKVMQDSRRSIVDDHGTDKVAQITQDIVRPFHTVVCERKKFRYQGISKQPRIDPGIEIATGIFQRSSIQQSIVSRRILGSVNGNGMAVFRELIDPIRSGKGDFLC